MKFSDHEIEEIFAAENQVFERIRAIMRQCIKEPPKRDFSRRFRERIVAAVRKNRNSHRDLIDPELRQIQEFKDSAKAFDSSSEGAFQKNVQALAERASECIRELSTTESPARWYQAITALSQLCQDARHFSIQLYGGDEHSIQDIEAEIVGRVRLQQRERAAQALANEMEGRLTNTGTQVGRISDLKTLLVAMDFYLSEENFRSFEKLAQRFIGGTSTQRTESLGEVENILAQHLPDCEEREVTERAARLRALLTRATSIGIGKALQEERAASAKQAAERDKEEGAEIPADLAVIARFVQNEDLQRQLHSALSKNDLEVGLIVEDVEEQLGNIVGREIALELLTENPLLLVDALLDSEQFRGYLEILSRVTPVISATRAENNYSPRFFCSSEAIQALIESEGAELDSETEHPEADIARDLQSAGVSSPQLAYAILRFGFVASSEYPHGAFIPEAARLRGVYGGIVGPIPSKERIRDQEAELARLGIITFGSKRSAALSGNTKLPKDLRTALWKMQSKGMATQALAIRID